MKSRLEKERGRECLLTHRLTVQGIMKSSCANLARFVFYMLFIIEVEIDSQLILCLWKSQMSKIFPTELVHCVGGLKIMTLINIWL